MRIHFSSWCSVFSFFVPVKWLYFCVAGVKDSRLYSCPIYKKPLRTDVNYIAAVELKTSLPPEHWILRGVALLCDVKWVPQVEKLWHASGGRLATITFPSTTCPVSMQGQHLVAMATASFCGRALVEKHLVPHNGTKPLEIPLCLSCFNILDRTREKDKD